MSTATARSYRSNSAGRFMPSGSRKNLENKPFYGRRSTSFAQAHCIKDSVLLDPAAGFGNFLTETYLSLRRLENDILRETITDSSGTGILGFDGDEFNPIKVSIQQFYGIEINDFAVAVAKTAIWIAEAQMFKETEAIIHKEMDFLPLHNNANIHEGNSLNMDWAEIINSNVLSYIMGNPPFVGAKKKMNKQQKFEMVALFNKNSSAKSLDYVAAWYKKLLNT